MFGSDRKNSGIPPFGGKKSYVRKIRGYNTWEEDGGSMHSFAR